MTTQENPHPVEDEDPEEHIGEAMLDPWDDDDQPDWPNEEVKI